MNAKRRRYPIRDPNEVLQLIIDSEDEDASADVDVSQSSLMTDTQENDDGFLITVDDQVQVGRASRKRKREPESWKRNIQKRLRQSGKSYTSLKTKQMRSAKNNTK